MEPDCPLFGKSRLLDFTLNYFYQINSFVLHSILIRVNVVLPYSLSLQILYVFFDEKVLWNFISHMPNTARLAH